MQTLPQMMFEALLHTSRASRITYSRPAGGYVSRRAPKVRNKPGSKRGDRKRAALFQANQQHAKQKKIEAAWRDGRYPKPPWAHASAKTRLSQPVAPLKLIKPPAEFGVVDAAMKRVREQITEQLGMRGL